MLDLNAKPDRPLVAASILASDFAAVADDTADVLAKGADLIHVDVMDGHFVANLSMGPDMVKGLRKHFPGAYLDVHLMVERPGEYIDPFADAGANHVSFHLEVCGPFHPHGHDADALIDRIKARGMHAGMVLNPYTPPTLLGGSGGRGWLDRLDMVLQMSVVPGKGGQSFMPHVLDNVRWLAERRGDATRLEIDGGIDPTTCGPAAEAGIDVMVIGSSLFGADDRRAVIDAVHGAGG